MTPDALPPLLASKPGAMLHTARLLATLGATLLPPLCSHAAQEDPPRIYTDYMVSVDVPFDRASALVSAQSRQLIQARFALTQTSFPPERRVVCAIVAGHADVDEGSEAQRAELSWRRAVAVAGQLMLNGMDEASIDLQHVAALQPIAPQPSRKNSRVEVEIFPCR